MSSPREEADEVVGDRVVGGLNGTDFSIGKGIAAIDEERLLAERLLLRATEGDRREGRRAGEQAWRLAGEESQEVSGSLANCRWAK